MAFGRVLAAAHVLSEHCRAGRWNYISAYPHFYAEDRQSTATSKHDNSCYNELENKGPLIIEKFLLYLESSIVLGINLI